MKINKSYFYIYSTFFNFIKFGNFSGLDILQVGLLSTYKKIRLEKMDVFYLAFILVGIFSSIINSEYLGVLYTFRLVPVYLIFILVRKKISEATLIYTGLVLCCFQIFLYPLLVYNWMAGVIAGLICIKFTQRRNYLPAILSAYIVFISDQRSLFVALAISFLAFSFTSNKRTRIGVLILILIVTPTFYYNASSHRVVKTFDSVVSINLADTIKIGIEGAKTKSYEEYVYGDRGLIGDNKSGDLSLHLRLRKWLHAASTMGENKLKILSGLGPSYFGKAADSTFVRIFYEVGIIGLLVFVIWYLKLIGGVKNIFSPISMYFLMSNMFLDVFYSPLLLSFFLPILYTWRKK
jgi:hypothetical protein